MKKSCFSLLLFAFGALFVPAQSFLGIFEKGDEVPFWAVFTDPATGAPREGTFTMTFRLYDVAVDGTALWVETKDVAVGNGLFSTALGDVESLPEATFDGRELWLGIKVGADAEAVPRHSLEYVAYSLSTDTEDLLDGKDPTDFAEAVRTRTKFALNESNGHRSCTIVNIAKTAVQLGRNLRFDPVKQEFIDDAGANRLVYQPMRAPWQLS